MKDTAQICHSGGHSTERCLNEQNCPAGFLPQKGSLEATIGKQPPFLHQCTSREVYYRERLNLALTWCNRALQNS